MAKARKSSPQKKQASKPVSRQRKPKSPRWQDLATHAVPKLGSKVVYQIRYGGPRSLDAPAAIVLLDNELARHRIRYEARYLGIRDGRAAFRIHIRMNYKHEQAVRDAVQRVGVALPDY